MYLGYAQVAADGTVKTSGALVPPPKATHVEIQADTQSVRYTMDGATDPTSSAGMLFQTTDAPRTFLIEDLNRIRFTQGAGGAGNLNLHYFAGRDI